MMIDLAIRPAGGFRAILADPPWRYENYSEAGEGKNPVQHYTCLPTDEIAALPVEALAARNAALFIWVTWPMLLDGIQVLQAWGFRYATGAPWAKRSKSGKSWAFGTGYILRNASEAMLIGTRGRPQFVSRSERNLFDAPVREHSRKPDEQYGVIERLLPGGPYLELFARTRRPGWTAWGDEAGRWAA